MQNMKISLKLVTSFLIVIIMTAAIGAVGITGMYRMETADDYLYYMNYLPTVMAGDISQRIVEQRYVMRNFILYDAATEPEQFQNAVDSLTAINKDMETLIADYEKDIVIQEDWTAYEEFTDVYHNEWLPVVTQVQELGTQNKTEDAKAVLNNAGSIASKVDELTTLLQNINLSEGKNTVQNNTRIFRSMTAIQVVMLVIAIAASMLMSFYISGLISKPMIVLTAFMKKAGSTGDLTLSQNDIDIISAVAERKDEIGVCIASAGKFVNHMVEVSHQLETVASGDLNAKINTLSQDDLMGVSLNTMTTNLNGLFAELKMASNQVAAGTDHVSQGAQGLAAGSNKQSSSIEQLNTSLAEVSNLVKDNFKRSEKALENCDSAVTIMNVGMDSMNQMTEAMSSIADSSRDITRVIKVIDDIAFQTNILALNAAVEAARAGQHGKGFAVVADEVRNLAAKSAEAAKETANLIEGSSQRVEEGGKIVEQTSESLRAMSNTTMENAELIKEMANSLEKQTVSVEEINRGMGQISSVVQANSATAEQSAAAAEQMSAQAAVMSNIVARFKLREPELGHNVYDISDMRQKSPTVTGFSVSAGKY